MLEGIHLAARSYWKTRQVQFLHNVTKLDAQVIKRLRRIYGAEWDRLYKEINAYYRKYGDGEILAYKELLRELTPQEKRELYEHHLDFFKQRPEYMHLLPVRESYYKLTRLEGLMDSITLEQYALAIAEDKVVGRHLRRIGKMALTKATVGAGYDHHTLELLIQKKWVDGKNFSERIWQNRQRLADYLRKDLRLQIARGDTFSEMTKKMAQKFQKVQEASIARIIRTEGTFIANEAIGHSMGLTDDDEYMFVAVLDNKTSKICSALDHSGPYRWGDRKTGENFPPMHPNCRSTFQLVDDEESSRRV